LLHADAPDLKPRIVAVVHWLQNLLTSAEQLDVPARGRRIAERILEQNFGIKGARAAGAAGSGLIQRLRLASSGKSFAKLGEPGRRGGFQSPFLG
jgi:hypothetical protein